jgi:SPFH domain / Band 7 family
MANSVPRNPIGLRLTALGLLAIVVVIFLIILGFTSLTGWITVPQGHFVVLMSKTGNDLPNERILATTPDMKGVQLEVLKEGYHFYNPLYWWWSDAIPATVIPEMNVGIVMRKYGAALEPGQVLAEGQEQKGILPEALPPGRHYINTYAYSVDTIPMVRIDPGFMGVVTLLVGKSPTHPDDFVMSEGERGTQPYLLPPGTHPKFSNPWVYRVVPIDTRSQKLELSGDSAVDFLSEDGFPIHTEGTIEYALDAQKLPENYVMFVEDTDKTGAQKNIEDKLIIPLGRSLYRIYGAQHKAVDYLIGNTRVAIQNEIEKQLKAECGRDGILIKSFVIRSIVPPSQIRQQYERRELARRQREQYLAEITKEVGYPAVDGGKQKLSPEGQPIFDHGVPVIEGGKPRLDAAGEQVFEGGRLSKELQSQMKDRAQKIGVIRLEVADVKRQAEQYSKVELTRASQRQEVAKLELEAANDLAAQKLSSGEAAASVIRLKNQAQVAGIHDNVDAFGGGEKYAQYLLATRLAPSIRSIWSNTEGSFAEMFRTITADQGTPAQPPSPSAAAAGGQQK